MKQNKMSQAFRHFSSGLGLSMLLLLSLGTTVSAGRAPNGPYAQREGGGTRACGYPMIAMAPKKIKDEEFSGDTTLASPEFWVDIPYKPEEVSSLVFRVIKKQEKNPLYEAKVAVPKKPGLTQFKLPEGTTLEIGQRYEWSLTAQVKCKDLTSGKLNEFKEQAVAWVERYEPNAKLSAKLSRATPIEKAQIFADEENTWYDAFSLLSKLRQTDPDNPQIQTVWNQTLQKYGLSDFSERPFASSQPADANSSSGKIPIVKPSLKRPIPPYPARRSGDQR